MILRGAIVDDDWYWRDVVRSAFESREIELLIASSYGELEASLNSGDVYEFVLCDVRMKGRRLNGIESISRLLATYTDQLRRVYIYSIYSREDVELIGGEELSTAMTYLSKENTDLSELPEKLLRESAANL